MQKRDDIVFELGELYKQATVERDHFYTGSIIMKAIAEIVYLRGKLLGAIK